MNFYSKLIYGNEDKVDEAVDKALFLFSEPEDRKVLTGINIVRDENLKISNTGSGTKILGTYEIEYLESQEHFQYNWKIEGNAILTSQSYLPYAVVQTGPSSVDETFTLTCDIFNDMSSYGTTSKTITHYIPIKINSLNEVQPGSCKYIIHNLCTATSTYTIDYQGVGTILWAVNNAIIISGQGTDTITVETTGNVDITFNVTCVISNPEYNDIITDSFTHTREMTLPTSADSTLVSADNDVITADEGY